MTSFQRLFINQQRLSEDFKKRLCFLNNVRSKYLTITLIICGIIFALYDIRIIQLTQPVEAFLLHFKSDLIFLVFSFVFTLYIFFNQVKSHKEIRRHHKYIHGLIAIIVLCWSIFKSVLYIKYNNGNFNIAIICILVTSFTYLFPAKIHLLQLSITLLFALIASLLFNLTLQQILDNIGIVVLITAISYIISRYLYYLQLKIFLKEKELSKYKRRINFSE